ncbi:hypothetical protein ACFE04_027264 [Oxalis oulophora]
MQLHETRSHAHTSKEENRMKTRKQKADKTNEAEQSHKKSKTDNDSVDEEFTNFSKAIRENLSADQMKEILAANGLDTSALDDVIISKCEDLLFYGVVDECPVCGGHLQSDGLQYNCSGQLSEWSSCIFTTKDPPRKHEPIKIPDSVLNSTDPNLVKKYQDPSHRPRKEFPFSDKPFKGMTISLSGRLSRKHDYWKQEIQRHGGQVNNSIKGVTCVVVSPAERERGGSGKLGDALETGIPIVSEAWLSDCIEKKEALPMDAYDVASDLAVDGKGIPLDKMDPSEEAVETLMAELKLYGKRGVYKDTKLQEQGGEILERDGLLYNCAFTLCDLGRKLNEYCIMQLITVPDNNLNMYYKKGKIGADTNAEERLEEWENEDEAIKEFARIFEELTGNEFLPWEREKKIEKKALSFFPADMDDGVDVRHGGLGLRQLGAAAVHSKLDPLLANFMKIMCSQAIYRYALMESGYDVPDMPLGMLTDLHLKRCEENLLELIEKVKSNKETGSKARSVWADFSSWWFALMPSTRPFIFRDYEHLADSAASALEMVRDINVASRLIGDVSGATIDDPLSSVYEKLNCKISPLDKESDEYKMILKYLETTYEPYKVGDIEYGVSVDYILAVDSSADPSYEEIKKLPNKVLLWCGTRSSNLLRHLHKGFLPSICSLPVPGYMFGKAIVCSDAAAEAAKYGFTAVDSPDGFLVLAVASLGDNIIERKTPLEDSKSYEGKRIGVKGLGRKKPDELEHFIWKDDIKVPCGALIESEHKDSPLKYNEYAVYNPKQASIRFLVAVKFEEKDVVYDTEE